MAALLAQSYLIAPDPGLIVYATLAQAAQLGAVALDRGPAEGSRLMPLPDSTGQECAA